MSDKEDDLAELHEATRSGRHIKRRKFDDEIVQTSLGALKAGPSQSSPSSTPIKMPQPRASTSDADTSLLSPNETKDFELTSTSKETTSPWLAPPSRPKSKKQKKEPPAAEPLAPPSPLTLIPYIDESDDDVDEWKPQNDKILVDAVLRTGSIELAHKVGKFSFPFTVEQLRARWRSILYCKEVSQAARDNIAELHPSAVDYLERKCPFSDEEEAILSHIPMQEVPTEQRFQQVLEANRNVFHPRRSAKHLLRHWQLMKQYFLLEEQKVPIQLEKNLPYNFSDVEDECDDAELKTQYNRRKDYDLDNEMRQLQRSARKEIKRLEAELPIWQSMVESVTGSHVADFDDQTLAVLRGRLVRYLMRSKEISLGRSSREVTVDIDFSLEGPAYKISRRQAIIKLRNNGEFVFANEGKRPVYIDGNPVLSGNKLRLNHNSVVEIASLRFVFLVNQKLINSGLADQIQ